MDVVDKISSAMRSAKFALIQAKKAIARNLDTGGEDEWAQCDYAIREIDVIDMGGDFDTLRSDLARVTAERDALRAEVEAMRAVVDVAYDVITEDESRSGTRARRAVDELKTALDALRTRKGGV